MAYKQNSPQIVAEGGTGAITLTDHAVIIGSGTAAVSFVGPVASTGALLASSGVGSDPGFTTATYPLTSTANELLYSSSTNTITGLTSAGDGVLITSAAGVPSISSTLPSAVQGNITSVGTISSGTWNGTDIAVADGGTGLSSATAYAVLCGGTTSTNPFQSIASVGTAGQVLTSNGAGALPTFQAAGGGTVTGPGSSTDNALARWNGTGGTAIQDSAVIVDDDGEMTNASQPAFLAYLGTSDSNVTGNSGSYQLGSGNALTEVFDQNGDFVTTGTFTAPRSGKYVFSFGARVGGVVASTTGFITIQTSNSDFYVVDENPSGVQSGSAGWVPHGCQFCDMDAADTCVFLVTGTGEASNVWDIISGEGFTQCAGVKIC